MDKEKLIISDTKIMRKIEERTLFDDTAPTITRILATTALGIHLLNFVTSPASLEAIDTIRNDAKPIGPYSLNEEPRYSMPMEPVPGFGADALQLSDDMDGLLSTSGYAVFVDVQRMTDQLKPDEVLVVTQEDATVDGTAFVSGKVFKGVGAHRYDSVGSIMTAAGIDLPPFESAVGTAGGEHSIEYNGANYMLSQINSGGSVLLADKPSTVVVDTYQIEADASVTPLSHRTATAEIVPNVECDDLPETISTEVYLTSRQHDIICQALEEYSQLLPNDYAIRLDAVDSSNSKNDSANLMNRNMQLTYPYIGKNEVEVQDLRRTALHEIFHAAYYDQIKTDRIFRLKLDAMYMAMRDSTDFRIPSDEELSKGLTPTLQKAEKVIGIITESEYIGPNSNSGHPWDNATEMLSSTAAVLAFYPEEFIEKYNQLNDVQKRVIRDNASAVLEIIDRYDVDAASIIPKEDLIREELGL